MSSSTRGERRLRSNTSTDTDVLVFPVTQIDLALRQYERDADSRTLVDQHVPLARQVITLLNDVDFIAPASDPSIQVYVVDVLQQLAFYDAEHGSVRDLETWSQNAWLTLSQAHPRNIAILLGQARHWLWRSYPGAPERPSQLVNGHESGGSSDTGEEPDDDDDDDDDISSPQVVTVRSYLQVSMDFVRAAVREAEAQSIRDGNLFQLAAEIYIARGTVGRRESSRYYFDVAISFLRQASSIQGFVLRESMQQYLDSFGSAID